MTVSILYAGQRTADFRPCITLYFRSDVQWAHLVASIGISLRQ